MDAEEKITQPGTEKMVSAHSGNDTMLFDKGYYLQGAYLFNLDPGDERRAASTMSQQENVRAMFTSSDISRLPVRERVGLAIQAADFITAITRIREA